MIWSFYCGAAILILCVLYTFMKVKEMPPKEYAEFHGFDLQKQQEGKKEGFIKLLAQAPKAFWTVGLVQFFCWAAFLFMWTYTNGAIAKNVWGTTDVVSEGYQAAGNWVGVVFAIQAVGSLCWALFIPKFKTNRAAYITSLVIGAIGFISVFFVHDKYLLFVSYFLIGFAWAAMLALPFSILTNALKGSSHMGEYLGLFNCTICLPQIVAAALGGLVLKAIGGSQAGMLVIAGVLLLCGAVSVLAIKEKHQ
ncbi:MAG: MFS transporter [Clostridiales bacterium]|nr:MFS transporter [Clostridiales bacterium]